MPTVGRTLATERVRQRLELDDAAQVTRINAQFLGAIEADEFDRLPGVVFARNFVRQYAQFLGMDTSAIIAQFDEEHSTAIASLPTFRREEPLATQISGSGFRLGRLFQNNTASAFLTFILTLAVCAGAFLAFQYWRTHRSAPAITELTPSAVPERPLPRSRGSSETNAPASQPPPHTEAPTMPSVSARAGITSPLAAGSGANVRVNLAATDTCWARITADGKLVLAGTLAPGETRTIEAASNVALRVGNAGAISVQLNGNEVPISAGKGQIRTISLTPAGAQVRTPNPEPVFDF